MNSLSGGMLLAQPHVQWTKRTNASPLAATWRELHILLPEFHGGSTHGSCLVAARCLRSLFFICFKTPPETAGPAAARSFATCCSTLQTPWSASRSTNGMVVGRPCAQWNGAFVVDNAASSSVICAADSASPNMMAVLQATDCIIVCTGFGNPAAVILAVAGLVASPKNSPSSWGLTMRSKIIGTAATVTVWPSPRMQLLLWSTRKPHLCSSACTATWLLAACSTATVAPAWHRLAAHAHQALSRRERTWPLELASCAACKGVMHTLTGCDSGRLRWASAGQEPARPRVQACMLTVRPESLLLGAVPEMQQALRVEQSCACRTSRRTRS
jgi:hypothetical protein